MDFDSLFIFWIDGKFVIGKIVLFGFVIDDIFEVGSLCSYYFFKYSEKLKFKFSLCLCIFVF